MINLGSADRGFKGGISQWSSDTRIGISLPVVILLLASTPVILPFNLPTAGAAGISLSEDAGGPSSKPQIAVSGNNVYV
ncbi:MAG: hypothetical protein ACREBU_25950, partial [Nitrososphaera sp.]